MPRHPIDTVETVSDGEPQQSTGDDIFALVDDLVTMARDALPEPTSASPDTLRRMETRCLEIGAPTTAGAAMSMAILIVMSVSQDEWPRLRRILRDQLGLKGN